MSAVTVKLELAERPALLSESTGCEPEALLEAVHEYAPLYGLDESSPPPVIRPRLGKLTLSMPDCASLVDASTVKLPLLPPWGL